jgi:hypothetical protein
MREAKCVKSEEKRKKRIVGAPCVWEERECERSHFRAK